MNPIGIAILILKRIMDEKCYTAEQYSALKLAINALSKENAMKPNDYDYEEGYGESDDLLYCNRCGGPTLHLSKCEPYCFICGQKVNWEIRNHIRKKIL